jgi:hypothetical protein
MAKVMKRERGEVEGIRLNFNAVTTRHVTCHCHHANVTGCYTVTVVVCSCVRVDVKLDCRLGLLSRCLFPGLMGEKMTI